MFFIRIFYLLFYHSFCYQYVTFLQRFYAHSLRIGEIPALRLLIYIDDGVAASRSFDLSKTTGKLVKNDLVSAEFIINIEKRDFNPKTNEK